MKIVSLTPDQDYLIQQAAQILVDAFKTHSPEAWPALENGLNEVHEMLAVDRILRVALDAEGNVLPSAFPEASNAPLGEKARLPIGLLGA